MKRIAGAIILLNMQVPLATTQTHDAANTWARARMYCPKGELVATMSVSSWAPGGWPLWNTTCYYKVKR